MEITLVLTLSLTIEEFFKNLFFKNVLLILVLDGYA